MTKEERETQQTLLGVKEMEKKIAVLETMLERLEYDRQKAARRGANDSLRERFHAINDALRDEFLREITRLNEAKAAVYAMLAAIRDEPTQMVMMERYMNGKTWEVIALDTRYGLSSVHRMHKNALRALAINTACGSARDVVSFSQEKQTERKM